MQTNLSRIDGDDEPVTTKDGEETTAVNEDPEPAGE